MATTRILDDDLKVLKNLAAQTGKTQQGIIHEALSRYQRESLLDQINAGFARLKANPAEWKKELAERKLWDNTLDDGNDR